MSATSLDLSQIKTDALSAASTFRTLIGLGSGDTPTFKATTLSTGTITASTPALDISQTWNNNAVAFTGLKLNATDTASSASSLLMDLQVGGVSKASIDKNGFILASLSSSASIPSLRIAATDTGFSAAASQLTVLNSGVACAAFLGGTIKCTTYGFTSSPTSAGPDSYLTRDSAGVIAQRNSTNAQTFRIYNTYTDASNYERAKIAWSSNVLQIGTEKLGTGSARALELQTDGTTRLTISSTGVATLPNTLDLTIRTVTYGATMAIDAALGNKIAITLTGNGTISNPTNAVDGRVLVFRLRQDATGSRIPVWDTKYSFVGDLATVTLSTAANAIDRLAFEYDSTDDKWYCISFIKGS